MAVQFRPLFSFAVNHDFYQGVCNDFDFLWSANSHQLLKRGRLLSKVIDGTLHCLYEADNGGNPINTMSEETLLLGLKLKNPYFKHFTDYTQSSALPCYRNQNSLTQLNLSRQMIPTSGLLLHSLVNATRPVDVSLLNSDGDLLEMKSLSATDVASTISFDLLPFGEGHYQIQENVDGRLSTTHYCYEELLFKAGIFGFVEMAIDASFYLSPPVFDINFSARTETLKYYVIADNYTDVEFAQLSVSDAGFAEESRIQINFNRVADDAFASDDISPSLLGQTESKITVFKSQTAIQRRALARKKIQLSRNGDVLIANLPAPGIEKAKADFVIHVAKP